MRLASKNCEKCPLRPQLEARQFAIPSTPKGPTWFAILGEAPGEREVVKHAPFVGYSGQLLEAVLENFGVSRDEVVIANAVMCRPPGNATPREAELYFCAPLWQALFKKYRVRKILGLGATAVGQLVGHPVKISKVRGIWDNYGDTLVMPSFHPAYVLRVPSAMQDLASDVEKWALEEPVEMLDVRHKFIRDPDEAVNALALLLRRADHLVEEWSLDLETSNRTRKGRIILDPYIDKILQVAIAFSTTRAMVFDGVLLEHDLVVTGLLELFEHPNIMWVGHNFEFDRRFLTVHIGAAPKSYEDTMLMHYLCDERRGTQNLKRIIGDLFGHPDYEDDLVQRYLPKKSASFELVPPEELAKYAALDVCYTLAVLPKLRRQVHEEQVGSLYDELVLPAAMQYSKMSLRGVQVDKEQLRQLILDLSERARELEARMREISDRPELNPRSPMQLSEVIYGQFDIPMPRGRRIKPGSTSKEALRKIRRPHPFIKTLQQYRRTHKLLSTYAIPVAHEVQRDGRFRVSFNLTATVTGRIAGGLLLTIPRAYTTEGKQVRDIFIATPGYAWVSLDYSQAEFRVFAVLTQDPYLLEAFSHGEDFHTKIARSLYGENFTKEERMTAKMFNFSYLYGGTEYSFAEDAGMPLDEARQWVLRYNSLMPTATVWKDHQFALARSQGFVTNVYGRRRRFLFTTNANQNDVRKQSVNAPVQSAVSDMILEAMLIAAPLIESLGGHFLLTFHDSVELEVPPEHVGTAVHILRTVLTDVARRRFGEDIPFPVDAKVGDRWGSLEDYHE